MIEKIELKSEVIPPKLFAVVIHNDDYTTMDFVVEVIVKVFRKTVSAATSIMLNIHENGRSVIDIFTYDIAITKKAQTEELARKKEFPLKVTIEEVL